MAALFSDAWMNELKDAWNDEPEVKDKLADFVSKGQLGIFTNGYWGHPAMKLSPDVNLLAVAHYLQALDYQKKANQIVAILGSKTPNIQNLAVGGVANATFIFCLFILGLHGQEGALKKLDSKSEQYEKIAREAAVNL